jgi:nitrogen PTS system EIIA component
VVLAIRDRIKETKKVFFDLLLKLQETSRDAVVITKYLDPSLIIFTSKDNRDDIIAQLVDLLEKEKKISDPKQFYDAVIQREKIISTGIGLGMAIPHAKLDEFDDFHISVAIHKVEGVDWNSLDKSLVKVVFLIGGPSNKQTEYLKILSGLTSAVKNEHLRRKLFESKTSEEVIELFNQHFSKES